MIFFRFDLILIAKTKKIDSCFIDTLLKKHKKVGSGCKVITIFSGLRLISLIRLILNAIIEKKKIKITKTMVPIFLKSFICPELILNSYWYGSSS